LYAHWLALHGLFVAVALLTYVITTHLLRQRRQPLAAISWILFIVLIPYVALPAFLSFGSRKLKRPWLQLEPPAINQDFNSSWVVSTITALQQPWPMAYRDLTIHQDGMSSLLAILSVIDQATQSIDICTYILRNDQAGEIIIDRLCKKARSGVQVRLLLDGFSNWNMLRPDLKQLTQAGGRSRLFVPPFGSSLKGRTNLRNHRKLAISDGELRDARMWCGGRNLSMEYFLGTYGCRAWRDLTFDVSGPIAWQARALFDSDWNFAIGERTIIPHLLLSTQAINLQGAQLVASGPDQLDDTIYSLLVTAAYQSSKRISLVSPYFIPDSALLTALCLAARRGVQIDVLIPETSNHPISDFARNRSVRALSQSGANIWLSKEMQHAKLAVIDDHLALVGSANIDNRSLFINYELMVAFNSKNDVKQFENWFDLELKMAMPYIPREPGLVRDLSEGMMLWVGFQL
jgi:cardiolipin synthase A/B